MSRFTARARQSLTELARNRRVQLRLEIGSAIALSAGLVAVIIFLLNFLAPLSDALAYFLFDPASASPKLIEQDRLVQVVLIFLLALLAGASLPHLGVLSAAGMTLVYLLVYLAYAYQKLDEGILVQPLYPALALALTFAGAMLFRYFAEDRPRALVNQLFRRQVPPEVIERIVRVFDAGAFPLAGARRSATVLCIDWRDFDLLAETLAPPALIQSVNHFLKISAEVVFRHEGILIKESSETLLAVWNLPLDQSHRAGRAVAAALELRGELRAAARARKIQIEVGIGIATGSVVAGNIGSGTRGEYGIIGAVATLANRLAGKSARGIYLDGKTAQEIGDEFDLSPSASFHLHGVTEPIAVWRVVEVVEIKDRIEEANQEE